MNERERIAYEELQADDIVQEGDQWLNPDGRWQALVLTPEASMEVGDGVRARRPYKISAILEIGDALANAQKAAAQLQDDCEHARKERDAARASEARLSTELWARKPLEDRVASLTYELAEVRAIEKQLCDSLDLLRREHSKLLVERDQARAEAARLSTELWARKPLEDRVASLTGEVAQLRLERQEWIDRYNAEVVNALQVSEQLTAAKAALKSAQRARDELQLQVDELRADRRDEPTAQQVQDMLRTWATELDWSAGCFDSAGRDNVSAAQRVLVVAIERIGSMSDQENSYAND